MFWSFSLLYLKQSRRTSNDGYGCGPRREGMGSGGRAKCCGRRKYSKIEILSPTLVLKYVAINRKRMCKFFNFSNVFREITISLISLLSQASENLIICYLRLTLTHLIGLNSLWVINCLTKGQRTNITTEDEDDWLYRCKWVRIFIFLNLIRLYLYN